MICQNQTQQYMNTKKWHQSKTMWFSIALAGIGILEAVTQSLQESEVAGISITVIGLISGLLRYVTSQPID